jgi:hypothetical protein
VRTPGGELQRTPSGGCIIFVPLLISISRTIRFYAESFFFWHPVIHVSEVPLIFTGGWLGWKIPTERSKWEREAVS